MNDRELRLFNLWAIRTKDELLGAIDEYIDRIEQHDDIEIVRKGRSKPLCRRHERLQKEGCKNSSR